jgi:hypothetical protein
MSLLTDEDRAALPAFYATENDGDAVVVRARLWLPGTYWEWFIIEYDGADVAFGLVSGHDIEMGYIWLPELEELGRVVRDPGWRPTPLGVVRASVEARRNPD